MNYNIYYKTKYTSHIIKNKIYHLIKTNLRNKKFNQINKQTKLQA